MSKIPVALEITKKCNSGCTHCYLSCSKRGQHLKFSRLRELVNKSKKAGLDIHSVSGGDPFIYKSQDKHLADVVNLISKLDLDVHVSGWYKTPSFLKMLRDKKVNFFISYTPYMPNYKKKFSRAFLDLEIISNELSIDIVATKKEEKLLKKELESFLYAQSYKKDKPIRKKSFASMKRGKKVVHLFFKKIYPSGRGKNIISKIPLDIKCIYSKKGNNFFYISISGDLYPCARAPATYLPPITNLFSRNSSRIKLDIKYYLNIKKKFIKKFGPECETCRKKFNKFYHDQIKSK